MPGDILKFLGLVTVIGGALVAGVIFLVGDGGGGTNLCDEPLLPLSEGEVSQMDIQAGDAGLASVIEAASRGNVEAANEAFYASNSEINNFTRNMDQPLREVDEEMAKDLCEAATKLGKEFVADEPKADAITASAIRLRHLVGDAAEALGYARPDE